MTDTIVLKSHVVFTRCFDRKNVVVEVANKHEFDKRVNSEVWLPVFSGTELQCKKYAAL